MSEQEIRLAQRAKKVVKELRQDAIDAKKALEDLIETIDRVVEKAKKMRTALINAGATITPGNATPGKRFRPRRTRDW